MFKMCVCVVFFFFSSFPRNFSETLSTKLPVLFLETFQFQSPAIQVE